MSIAGRCHQTDIILLKQKQHDVQFWVKIKLKKNKKSQVENKNVFI